MITIALLGMLLLSQVDVGDFPYAATTTFRSSDGVLFTLTVTGEEAKRAPEWRPEEGQPAPLALKLAIDLARDSVKTQNPDFEDFEATEISIRHIGGAYLNRWYYIIQFSPVVDGRALRGSGYAALVLMDGTVKAPEVNVARPPN